MSGETQLWSLDCTFCSDTFTTANPLATICPPCNHKEILRRIGAKAQANAQSDAKQMTVDGLSPDAPTITTKHGGKHSYTGLDFTQLDPGAMFEAAAVMYHGSEKYGLNNWKGITTPEHINHAIMHLYGYLKGDTQDKHLVHALVRCMMALVIDRDGVTPR